jgi:dihydropteroate synthase
MLQLLRPEISSAYFCGYNTRSCSKAAVAAGVDIINDISGATFDPEMLSTVAFLGVPIVLMHLRGTPQTMQQLTDYQDLMGRFISFSKVVLQVRSLLELALLKLLLTTGIGFAKKYNQSLEIIRRLSVFHSLNCPILVGVSRKSSSVIF